MKNEICEAIKSKRLLQFQYDGLVRVVEPHLLGRKTSGKDSLSAYLVRGYTKLDREPFWACYVLSEMKSLVVLDEIFAAPREGYNPNDKGMKYVFCRLAP